MNDKQLIEKMRSMGLTEYKATYLLKRAAIQRWTLQRAFFQEYSRLFITDILLIIYFMGFIFYLALYDAKDALFATFMFGMILTVMECFARFHKDYFKTIKILFGLRGLPIPKKRF